MSTPHIAVDVFPTLEKIAETVLTSVATTVTFSGLDLSTDKEYRIVADLVNNTASASNISLSVNGDTTATNYYEQYLIVSNTTVSAGRGNDNIVSRLSASDGTTFELSISRNVDGKISAKVYGLDGSTGNTPIIYISFLKWVGTDNITSLRIGSGQNMKIGSKLILFRVSG